MKLLFITPYLTFPLRSGGSIMLYNYIRQLSKSHEIDVVAFTNEQNPDHGDLDVLCRQVQYIEMATYKLKRSARLLNKLRGVPTQISPYQFGENTKQIHAQIRERGYDAVIFQFTEMAQFYLKNFHGASILMMEDPLVLKFQRSMQRFTSRLMRLRIWYEAFLLKRFETHIIKNFDKILLINRNDLMEYVSLYPEGRFDWIPYGVDIHYFCLSDVIEREEGAIVITGNMSHTPNVDAVLFFCEHVFPLVLERSPHAHLYLVGANPIPDIQRLAEDKRITVTGSVPDIRPYLWRAKVSVCAVKLRIGTQTKVLEAMGCGTPVVTTSAGNHGIHAIDGNHLYVADEPHEIAKKVISLINDENWHEIAQNGHQFVIENFAWEVGPPKLESMITQILNEKAE